MNWINAKDMTPRHFDTCLIYVPNIMQIFMGRYVCDSQDLEDRHFIATDTFSFQTFMLNKWEIYWIYLNDIPTPEIK